jgi:hypothetical protein
VPQQAYVSFALVSNCLLLQQHLLKGCHLNTDLADLYSLSDIVVFYKVVQVPDAVLWGCPACSTAVCMQACICAYAEWENGSCEHVFLLAPDLLRLTASRSET